MFFFKPCAIAVLALGLVGFDTAYGCSCCCCKGAATAAPAPLQPANGTPAAKTMQLNLSVSGMSCVACAAKVQKALMGVPGVRQAQVDARTGKAVVTVDEDKCDEKAMIKAVEQAGYGAKVAK
jgi:copper chaperone CopZ